MFQLPIDDRGTRLHEGQLGRTDSRYASHQQAVFIDQIKPAAGLGFVYAGVLHRDQQKRGDANAG